MASHPSRQRIAGGSRRCGPRPASTTPRCAPSRRRRCGSRSCIFASGKWRQRHAAHLSFARSAPSNPGGWTTTSCSGRCTPATTSARGWTGRRSCAIATRARSTPREPTSPMTSCFASTCSGWLAISGGSPGSAQAQWLYSATCRSWSAPTARTSGHDRTSSASMSPSASRPTPSATRGRTGGFPPIGGTCSRRAILHWLRHRARRNADLYDGYRVDHLVGFYRTYFRERDGDAGFTPPDEPSQQALGEQVMDVFLTSGAEIIAEDLGIVPDFVRASLARLGVPGYKVLRWERQWDEPGEPFRDPGEYPPVAVATSGTHDTEPMAIWWEQASAEERAAVLAIPSVRERLADDALRQEQSDLSSDLRRRAAGIAVRVWCQPADPADSGRLRLARSNQSAGNGQ